MSNHDRHDLQLGVPASSPIRLSRIDNIDSDRIVRRLDWLLDNRAQLAYDCDSRNQLGHLARQIIGLQRALRDRGIDPRV
ncbi:MAG TPA: hypothetical protein VMW08_00345 [Acidimicrobiales bacterium]|nr:hypothetical protein [Acidimicrobiales bacterium]